MSPPQPAGGLGTDPPGGLLLAGGFELGGQPALDVIGIHPADVAEQAGLDDVAAEPRGPVAEVGVGHAERHAQLAGGLDQVGGFLGVEAERFLTEHGDARVHGPHRRIVMDEVGGDDEDVVELFRFGQGGVGGDHFLIGTVAGDRERPVGGFLHRDLGVREQRSGGDPAGAVHQDGLLVRMDDKGAFAAADESDIEWFVRHGVGLWGWGCGVGCGGRVI